MKHILIFLVAILGFCSFGMLHAQSEATKLADAEFKRLNAELNQIYKEILDRISDPVRKEELIKSQQQWITFRDADAHFRAAITSEGGSAYSIDYFGNLSELTELRIKHLKALMRFFD